MMTARFLTSSAAVAGARPIDRLFEQFFGHDAGRQADDTPTYALPLDILETEDAYELHATVAGVPQDGADVTFDSGMRKLELPREIDSKKITARFENGVLRVHVPKVAKVQPVRIPIGGAGKAIGLPKGRG